MQNSSFKQCTWVSARMITTVARRADSAVETDAADYKLKEESENSEGLREETGGENDGRCGEDFKLQKKKKETLDSVPQSGQVTQGNINICMQSPVQRFTQLQHATLEIANFFFRKHEETKSCR